LGYTPFLLKTSCKARKSESEREKANIFFCGKERETSIEIGEIVVGIEKARKKRGREREKKHNFPGKENKKAHCKTVCLSLRFDPLLSLPCSWIFVSSCYSNPSLLL